jgi:acyl-CoA thioesterase-1
MNLRTLSVTFKVSLVAMAMLCVGVAPLLADQTPPATPVAKIRVACVGDSITRGDWIDPANRWTSVLQTDLGPGYDVENYAVSGATLFKNGDWSYWNRPALAQALALQPSIVFIMLGTNDSKPQNLPSHPGEFAPDLRALIAQFKALPTRPRIWLILPPPVFGNGLAGISEGVLAGSIRPEIRKVAKQTRCRVIDLAPILQSHPEDTNDHVHPTIAGHLLIGNAVAAAIVLKTATAPK